LVGGGQAGARIYCQQFQHPAVRDQHGNYVRGEDYRGPVFAESSQVPELPQAVRLGLESDAENHPPAMIESLARDEARVARSRRVREMQSRGLMTGVTH
jgi:hypothetical protein